MKRKADTEWVKKMMQDYGRRMTVETIMTLYDFSRGESEREVYRCMDITPEQIDGTAEKLIVGGVLC